jgi:hypothetical protein
LSGRARRKGWPQHKLSKSKEMSHSHHSDRPVHELASSVHGDLDQWIDEELLEERCGHDHVGVEHLCPLSSSFGR